MLTARELQESPASGHLHTGFKVSKKGLVMVMIVVLKFCIIFLKEENSKEKITPLLNIKSTLKQCM